MIKIKEECMRCNECGVDNDKNAEFCRNCGSELKEPTSQKKAPKHIKKIFYTGYVAVILLTINFFINVTNRNLNGIFGKINLIILISGILMSLYFYIQYNDIKEDIKKAPNVYYNIMIKKQAFMTLLILLSTIVQNFFRPL